MLARAFFAVVIVAYIAFAAVTFYSSLPTWCKYPERPGNSLVQPLCK